MRTAPLRRIRIAAAAFAAGAAALWGAGIAELGRRPGEGVDAMIGTGAATCTIVAVMLWVALVMRDRDKELLVRAIADLTEQPAGPPTGPLSRLRRVA